MGWFRNWLIDPTVEAHDVDSPEFSLAHRLIVQRKLILRKLFESFYQECRAMDLQYFDHCQGGGRLELGSGAGIISEVYPDVITSDMKVLPFIDLVLDALVQQFQVAPFLFSPPSQSTPSTH